MGMVSILLEVPGGDYCVGKRHEVDNEILCSKLTSASIITENNREFKLYRCRLFGSTLVHDVNTSKPFKCLECKDNEVN